MTKFHINAKGVPAPCRATKGNCPFGGSTGEENHYNSLEEAQKAIDKQNEQNHGYLPEMKMPIKSQVFEDFLRKDEVVQERLENFIEHYYKAKYNISKFSKSLLGRMEFVDSQVHLEILESSRNKPSKITFLQDKLGSEEEIKDYIKTYNELQDKIEDIVGKQYEEKYGVNKFSKSVLGRLEFTENSVFVGINETPYNKEDFIEVNNEMLIQK